MYMYIYIYIYTHITCTCIYLCRRARPRRDGKAVGQSCSRASALQNSGRDSPPAPDALLFDMCVFPQGYSSLEECLFLLKSFQTTPAPEPEQCYSRSSATKLKKRLLSVLFKCSVDDRNVVQHAWVLVFSNFLLDGVL